jgi:beta-mannosidase
MNQSDSLDISSEDFKNHQKHSRGFELIDTYMKRDFPVPEKAEDYVYMSQLLQAYGITKGIEAQRRSKPYNMGTLFWQLNDCWPAVSWSSIDYFGNWKALQYKAKRSFVDILISSKVENNSLKIWLVNDNMESQKGLLSMHMMDFNGNIIWKGSQDINVDSLSSDIKFQLDLSTIQFNRDEIVLVSQFKNNVSYFYFVKPKDLKLQSAEIQRKITKTEDGFSIELSSETLQKDVFLFTTTKGHFSDNFFDLLPYQSVIIHFKTKSKSLDDLQLKSFNIFIS